MERVMEILKNTKALLEGHFVLSSGLHSSNYVQCAKVFEYPEYGQQIGKLLAEKIKDKNFEYTVVIGPALGGVIVAYEVAKFLGIRAMFAEREENVLKLRRGFELTPDDKVLIVEDVVTTGKSTLEVVEVVKGFGAQVIGFASIINRSGSENPFQLINKEYVYLVKFDFPTYKPEECPLCKSGVPVIKPGSRKIK
ncbi:MAG: orotate phosphoribosyltransferase [Fervidobacterium sp.]|jgi:orotate phosphoribosyltransferase